jgi:hypothetical protein
MSNTNFDVQRFDLKKLNDAEVKEQYRVKISNMYAAYEDLGDNMDTSIAWENIRENIEI